MTLPREISVIIPVFNRRAMVVEAIESVMAQEDFALEILVVDDGSTDGSADAVRALVEKGYPITLLVHERNRGVSAARNTALAVASKPLIGFLDSDDLLLPGAYDALWGLLADRPDIDISYGLRQNIKITPASAAYARSLTLKTGSLGMGGVLLRADLVNDIGPFDESLRVAEDMEWFARISGLNDRIGLCQAVTLYRRLGDDNLTADIEAIRRSRLAMVRKRLTQTDQR